MCPAQHTYMDMAHTGDPDDWGASWAAFISLADSITWSPILGDTRLAPRVIGVQGVFWSEFTIVDYQIEPMIGPHILGVAQQAWNPEHALDPETFVALVGTVAPLFDAIGWARNPSA